VERAKLQLGSSQQVEKRVERAKLQLGSSQQVGCRVERAKLRLEAKHRLERHRLEVHQVGRAKQLQQVVQVAKTWPRQPIPAHHGEKARLDDLGTQDLWRSLPSGLDAWTDLDEDSGDSRAMQPRVQLAMSRPRQPIPANHGEKVDGGYPQGKHKKQELWRSLP
jgi:hypothetical protein